MPRRWLLHFFMKCKFLIFSKVKIDLGVTIHLKNTTTYFNNQPQQIHWKRLSFSQLERLYFRKQHRPVTFVIMYLSQILCVVFFKVYFLHFKILSCTQIRTCPFSPFFGGNFSFQIHIQRKIYAQITNITLVSRYSTVACTVLFTLEGDHPVSEREAFLRLNSDSEHEQPIEFLDNLFFPSLLLLNTYQVQSGCIS